MSDEDLTFKVDQLSYKIHDSDEKHKKLMACVQSEARDLHKRLVALKERALKKDADQDARSFDDTWTRVIEWEITNCSERFRKMQRDESIYSPEFSIMGFSNIQLEFFPKGRESTNLDGFCSLFLWCDGGVRVKYQLRVGEYTAAPDEDDYKNRMGHGHSNFCLLAAQIDPSTDSIKVGVEVLSIVGEIEQPGGIRLHAVSPEKLILQEASLLKHRDMECIEWTIKDIKRRIREVPQGLALCSPLFSACGVTEMLMEFYPNGIKDSTKEGYCGFYLRCPAQTSLIITLFVGSSNKGPIKTDFDGNAAKGLPEFCKLQDQLVEGTPDLIVGIKLRNPVLEKQEGLSTLELSSDDFSFSSAE
jgi:hypothetical protein